jgi:hypothetical protein
MNERIKELALQAGHPGFPRGEIELQKFAELIVQECARVARATPAPNFHEHLKQQLGHTWDMACVESGRQIVEHFGVEK